MIAFGKPMCAPACQTTAIASRTRDGTAYETRGNDFPVLLIHGLGACHAMWQWQVPALEERFRVIRYDLLGHGESRAPSIPCSMEEFVAQVLELMDTLSIERVAIVGFSLGGLIARAFAVSHPERTAALVVLSSAHARTSAERAAVLQRVGQAEQDGPAATVDAAIERWFSPEFAKRNTAIIEQVRRWVLSNDRRIYPQIYRLLAEGDAPLVDSIAKIHCPTLIMTGDDDRGNSPEMARAMAERIPHARLSILPGLRHMALAEDPAAVNSVLIEFLTDALGASASDPAAQARGEVRRPCPI